MSGAISLIDPSHNDANTGGPRKRKQEGSQTRNENKAALGDPGLPSWKVEITDISQNGKFLLFSLWPRSAFLSVWPPERMNVSDVTPMQRREYIWALEHSSYVADDLCYIFYGERTANPGQKDSGVFQDCQIAIQGMDTTSGASSSSESRVPHSEVTSNGLVSLDRWKTCQQQSLYEALPPRVVRYWYTTRLPLTTVGGHRSDVELGITTKGSSKQTGGTEYLAAWFQDTEEFREPAKLETGTGIWLRLPVYSRSRTLLCTTILQERSYAVNLAL
ncbi:hypothetical protein B0H12DRAFT_1067627 [Mycena haematopus]|nr:hypothetical protein B0H12DRAFT_1067627 [Mycena haematopus]